MIPWSRVHFPADFPPMFLRWYPLLGPEIVVPLALAGAFLFLVPRIVRLRLPVFLATLIAFSWLFAVTLAIESGRIRTFDGGRLPGGGAAILSAPFVRHSEYYAAVPLIEQMGPRAFAERFPELDVPRTATLPTHVSTHPPGGPMFLWLLWKLTGGSVLAVSLVATLIGALGALPTYAMAKEIYGEGAARTAAVLFACSPGVIVFSATSMDVVFMTIVATAAAVLVRAPRSAAWAVGAGAATAVALSFTWGALGLGIVGLGVGLIAIRAGGTFRRVAVRGSSALAGLAVGGFAIKLLTGIDLVASYGPTYHRQTHYLTYQRSAPYWLVGNVVAFLISAGIAQTSLLVAETKRRWREHRPGFETVVWAALVASTLTMAFKGETDHNWLFWIPFLVTAAAAPAATSAGDLREAAGGGIAQAVVTEALFYTGW
jgi:hypothetical protein